MWRKFAVVLFGLMLLGFAGAVDITYQGKLTDSLGVGINDTVDIILAVYSDVSGGTCLDADTVTNVPVVKGMFSAIFDLNLDLSSDTSIYYQVSINRGSGYTTLSPRKKITAEILAMWALNAIRALRADSATYADTAAYAAGCSITTDELVKVGATGVPDFLNEDEFERKVGDHIVIKDGAIMTSKLHDGAVTTPKIAAGAVTETKIQDDAVTSEKIKNFEVKTDDIDNGAVTEAKLANGAVSSDKIQNGAIITDKIANGAVDSDKILDGSVATADLANGAVTSDKLADNAVTSAKLADGAVTTDKIADDAVTDAKINWGLGAGQVNAEDIPYDNATYTTVDAALDHLLGISGTWSDSLEHVVVVAKNGSDASGDGSDKSPFLTINKAIDFGLNDAPWHGEDFIVLIAPGTYAESVLVNSDHVHIVGMNPKTVIIQSAYDYTVKFDGTSGNSMMWVTVKNTGAGNKAIIVDGADDLYFKDVFASATGSGSNVAALELIGNSPEVTIDQGAYQGKKYGIYSSPSTGTAVLRIYNASILGESDDGMYLYKTTAELHSGAVTTNSLTACDINADDNTEILMGAMKYRLGKVCLDTANGATFEHFILQDRIIDSLMLADNAVVTRTIADASVTGAKIASDAITSDKIVNRDVLGEDIHQDAITNYHIKDGTVLQPEIGWGFGADSISAADMPFDRTIALSHGYTLADSSTQTIIDSIITKLYGVAHGDTVFTRYIVSSDTVFIEDMVATREVATDTIEAFKTNKVYVRDTLYVDNSVEVEQNVNIGHNILVNNNASVMGNFEAYGSASFYDDVDISGNLDVGGVISVDTFVTDLIYSTGDTVFVNDFLYVERELVVDSIQAVGDTVIIDDNLLVHGGAKFDDDITVSGDITAT
ncbi:hypothetical protein J7J62_00045, partial [bacterium]|nr:hypothetical protein [bacterium]